MRYYKPKLLVIENPSEPVDRDLHLDAKPSILENRPTETIQFAQGFGAIGLNMLATSNLRYYKLNCVTLVRDSGVWSEKLTNFERLCVHTVTTKPWSIEKIIENYPKAGVKAVSVWRDLLENRDAAKIGERIQAAGMEVVSLVRGGFFTGTTETEIQASLDDNRRAIDEAHALGAPMVCLVCGAVPGQSIQRSLSQIQVGLETLLPYAEKHGVKLGIEPLHPMYADSRSAICTLKTANEFAERFNSPYIGVVVDVFHLWWDPDLENECKRCGKNGNLFAFHICDWKQDMEDMLNDRGLMGEGVIRVREIRSWVEAAGFDGFHEVEIFSNRLWESDQKELLERIKQAYLEYA